MNNHYKQLPKKRMGVGVLIFNGEGKLLIVKPNYKKHWSIPGGVIDENESPREGCIREVKEEIGIELKTVKFLCVDYTKAEREKDESLQFIFYGGQLDTEQKGQIKIDGKEISECRFVSTEEAIELFGGEKRSLARRLPKCLKVLKKSSPIYLENGE